MKTLMTKGITKDDLEMNGEDNSSKEFSRFSEFYPFYLQEHSNATCRRLHVIGSLIVVLLLIVSIATNSLFVFLSLPIVGYSFAWVGHFFFEKNKPATFKYPFYSLLADWVILKDTLTGKISW